MKKEKRSVCLLISAILGIVYAIILLACFFSNLSGQIDVEKLLAISKGKIWLDGILSFLTAPHMIFVIVAAVFNALGWAMNKRSFALVGGILYAVAAVFFPLYALFVVAQIVLSFVGYEHLKAIIAENEMMADISNGETEIEG